MGDNKEGNGPVLFKNGRCNLRCNSFQGRVYYLVMILNGKCDEIWYPQTDKMTKLCHLPAKGNHISSCFTEVTEFRHQFKCNPLKLSS